MSAELVPCFCHDCGGQPCNRTTVRRHFQRGNVINGLEDLVHESNDDDHDHDGSGHEDEYSSGGESVCDNDGSMQEPASSLDSNNVDIELDDDSSDSDHIKRFVLRHLKNKVQHGLSQEATLSGLRNLYELLGDDRIPHQNWTAVLGFLRELGYQDARVYKICFGTDHVNLIDGNGCCVDCGKQWNNGVSYLVLGFNFEDTFLSNEFLLSHMAHWKSKDEWFNQQGELNCNRKEIWHGARFRELSYFWDKNKETELPAICPVCSSVFPAELVFNLSSGGGEPVNITCHSCFSEVEVIPDVMVGCPFNQAYIIHEDGFNAFTKKTRGIASIQFSSTCRSKEDRSHGDALQVYSFVPTCHINGGIAHKMDAFFRPLIDDVKKYYVQGIPVSLKENLNVGTDVIPVGTYTGRLLVLCGTADIKAHAEITLYCSGGKLGCRRCLVCGTYMPEKRHYYYGNFRRRFRHRDAPRTVAYQLEKGKQCDEAFNTTQRKQIQTETGVCGVCCLFELYDLYGFDPIQDMLVDRMHLVFNMLKREFLQKFWLDIGENVNVDVNERDPNVGGLLLHGDFSDALKHVRWTAEQKASGVGKLKHLNDSLGGWKHAEFLKYGHVAREILAGSIPSRAYDIHMKLCRMVKLLYNRSVKNLGWSNDDILALESLAWSHAISAEEYYGLGMCTENLEYSTHLAEDVKRHSSPDNYSCEVFERAIRAFKQQTNNAKGIEKTFAERENIKVFIRRYELTHGPLSTYVSDPAKIHSVEVVNDLLPPMYFHESSLESAKSLIAACQASTNDHVVHPFENGVLLGKLRRITLQNHQMVDIARHLRVLHPEEENVIVPPVTKCAKHVVKVDCNNTVVKFSKGDCCILSGGNDEEWHICITDIILIGAIGGKYHVFIDGTYYIPVFDHGQVVKHPWTDTVQLGSRAYTRDSIQLASQLKRKCLMYPEPENRDNPSYFLCVDFDGPPPLPVSVPVYPEVGDDLVILGTGRQNWYGRVASADDERHAVDVKWFVETRRAGVFKLSNREDTIFWKSVLGFARMVRIMGGYRLEQHD